MQFWFPLSPNEYSWLRKETEKCDKHKELNQQGKIAYTKTPQPVKEMALWKLDSQEWHEVE